jgi:hypothetical protein
MPEDHGFTFVKCFDFIYHQVLHSEVALSHDIILLPHFFFLARLTLALFTATPLIIANLTLPFLFVI